MGELDTLGKATTTQLKTGVPDYSVSAKTIDEAGAQKETSWCNPYWTKYLGYYKTIPELRQAVNALATWTAGKGWTSSLTENIATLDRITGWGEDSFDSIMQNLIVTKKINGDAFAEIIRNDTGTLINLKPLNPQRMKTVVNSKGLIIRYEEIDPVSEKALRKYEPQEIFHIVNERTANEIHGTSVIEACQWVIDARNEAMSDWRRILHRSSIRVLYVDEDDPAKIQTYRAQYKEAIKNGEVLIMPGRPADANFQELTVPPGQVYMEWIRYTENFFYQSVGVPKIILGGSAEYTEASSKVGYLTFEQVYMTEQKLLEQDLWNQLGIRITFNRPVSLKENIMESEAANTGQVGFQPNEITPSITRNE